VRSTTDDARLITDEHAAAFERDGAVRVQGLLDADELRRFAWLFDLLVARGDDMSNYYGDDLPGKTIVNLNGWRTEPSFLETLTASSLPRAAAQLLDSTQLRLYEDLLIFKTPGTEQPTSWHQDEPQWPVTGRQMCSGWFCLDAVDEAGGALRFARGSHLGRLYRPYVPEDRLADVDADARFFDGGDLPDIEADPVTFPVVSFDVRPGDVVFFHPRMLHHAFGSAPTHARRTLSIRFLGDDVRFAEKRSVFYESLAKTGLADGDRLSDADFPLLTGAR
jgi:ectoine hydroxylase-related dioxygenase (phytanoyl-CoA dioxygenase family)